MRSRVEAGNQAVVAGRREQQPQMEKRGQLGEKIEYKEKDFGKFPATASCTVYQIVTSSLPYSIIHPPSGLKNRSNNGASAEPVTFPFSTSIGSSQRNSFLPFLILRSDLKSFSLLLCCLSSNPVNAGCFLSLPILFLFSPPASPGWHKEPRSSYLSHAAL